MRNLSTYIEYLLMTRHYCYVPGRGAYMMSEEPATQGILPVVGNEKSLHEMMPPKRIVRFSTLHHHDDGILANLLMEAEGMSYDEACRYIKRQAPLLSDDFSHTAALHTDVDNFGFETLQIETWGDMERRLQADVEPLKPEIEEKQSPRIEVRRDSVSIPTYWLKRAAIALLIAIFFFTDFIGLNKNNDQLASVLNVSILQQPVLVHQTWDEEDELFSVIDASNDELENIQISDIITPTPIVENSVVENNEAPSGVNSIDNFIGKDAYYIVVGSTRSEKDAHRIYNRYANDEYPSAGIMIRGGLYRVFVNVIADKEEATSYLRSVRKVNERLSKAWMFPVSGEESLSYVIKNIYNDNQLSMELSHPKQRTERDQG